MSDPAITAESIEPVETLVELRTFLHQQTGISVGANDPVMIQHVMHRLFLADYDLLLGRHNQAITVAISAAVKGLTHEAISENLKEQVRLADRTHQEFEHQYKRAKRLSVVSIIASTVSILCVSICSLVIFYLYTN
jgi:K+-sensing histidine kinase KdpD